jgi:glycerol-3-phosphate acyltransferase PlsY
VFTPDIFIAQHGHYPLLGRTTRIMSLPVALGLSLLLGAAFGSIPFGYIAGRLSGTDIRTRGSGNIGFTNVQRTVGWAWAAPVLVLDVAKGLVPTALAAHLGLVPALVGLGAVLGHVFTPWLRFNGGKGVATTIGVAALLCPRSLLAALLLYLVVLLVSGFISLSSLAMAAALPLLTLAFYRHDLYLLLLTLGIGAVILVRHRSNIQRLAARTEPRLSLWLRLFRRT